MKVVIVRHADAGDSESFAKTGKPDSARPLSSAGRKQMRAAAKVIVRLVPDADLLVSSNYARAVQTAELLAEAYDGIRVETTDALTPEAPPSEMESWLREHGSDVVVVVGHEPHLGKLIAWLTTGGDDTFVDLKKGGAALIRFRERFGKANGELRWLMGPKELR